jgi:F0F1-type ATP synthase assembly protein I
MGSGWYGVAVTDESRPTSDRASETGAPSRVPAPASDRAPRSRAFFSSFDASMLGLGSQMLSEVVAGVILGFGIDYMLGTRNRWIVVGSIAGVVVAMVTVFRIALRPQTPRRQAPGQKPAPPSRSNGEPS